MCSGFVLEPFGHRQGRRGKASTISVDRVGGLVRIGRGADRGVAPAAVVGLGGPVTRVSLVTQGTAFVMKGDSLQGAKEGKDQNGGLY